MRDRQQHCEIAKLAVDAGRGRQPVISGDRRLPVAVLGNHLGFRERSQEAVAAALLSQRCEQPRGICGLTLPHQRQGRRIAPGLGPPFGSFVAAPRRDRPGHNQDEHDDPDDVFPVARPELKEIFAAQLLVDFTKDVAHTRPEPV